MRTRPLLVGAVLVLAVAASLFVAAVAVGTPQPGIEKLALVLSLSGAVSLLLGAGLVRLVSNRIGSLYVRIILANSVGQLMALVNVLVAAMLMFLNSQDLGLFILLLGFAGVISLAFGYSVAAGLMSELGALRRAATRLAAGDFGARVGAAGSGEIARLAATFDAMADRVQATLARERELEANRRELMAAISHDLRTPLATTRAMVEAIHEGVLSDSGDLQHYTRAMRGEVQHLTRLIDDLFELSRMEDGALEPRPIPISLAELIAEVLAAYQVQARDRGIALRQVVEADLRPVAADPEQLQRVLRNFIDNALRHTPSGGTVRIEARADGVVARVSVSDSGPGLAADDVERVFEPFYRSEHSGSRASDGSRSVGVGLGLAIASTLVRAHRGRTWADRSDLGGAGFHFTIPFSAGS